MHIGLQVTFAPKWNPAPSKGFNPQQAFLSLKSTESGKLVLVAAKASKDGAYTVSLTPDIIAHQIGTQVSAHARSALWSIVM